ncbi:autophagy-related protein 22-like protein [Microdochium trichocladiopsis]|uniref:Autophagy-related protein n=1 Tax=Microdochium trichocladiopsis TaxID=1682393 RepID=A0A9P8Y5A8_9PEZI|nr:autophagy-related protein 22-like protein [Microdochium trichocladiopsis]KAH7031447.1 autophagy-related protein 22-like protein [Microdochium trichocladiopsis]
MPLRIFRFREENTALYAYTFGLGLVGIPFAVFGTYVVYQVQVTGFTIGSDGNGGSCLDFCLVPLGSQLVDLNSVLLYLNAIGFAVGGACAVLVTAYADFWKNKALLVSIMAILYGAVCTPVHWLRVSTASDFDALLALYVVFAVLSYTIIVGFNIFIPHCMRTAEENARIIAPVDRDTTCNGGAMNDQSFGKILPEPTISAPSPAPWKTLSTARWHGFKMSIMGDIAVSAGGILSLVVVIILARTLPTTAAQTAGLLVTTIVGFVTIAGSVVLYLGLPQVAAKPPKHGKALWLELVVPLKDLLARKNMAILLLSYTIYVDTTFALRSVTSQLYFVEILPDTLEYSMYSLAGNLMSLLAQWLFFGVQSWRPVLRLEAWLIVGYALALVIPIWGCIGLSESVGFGFKHRWEFYVQNLILVVSGAIVNSSFRVLYSELMPKGNEVQWFGLQVVLSCATAWVSYVANAPIQNATHQLRFPLILCLLILVIPVVLEAARSQMAIFARDKSRWQEHDAGQNQEQVIAA